MRSIGKTNIDKEMK